MIYKQIAIILATILFLGFLIYYNYSNLEFKKQIISITNELEKFKSKGPRFTAKDGQDLCEEIQAMQLRLEGRSLLQCHYVVK